jgi:isoleucyl-tRNA synthetase
MSDRPNFPQMEEEILKNWEAEQIFEKTLAKASPKGRFVFFEGPPTANGKPGIHHVEARAFKDCILRYRTMQGYHVDRKAGWDTHGLPVEIEVEKQLGFTGKKDIEEFGIEPFNAKCRESVWKYLEEWQSITKRIGFWLDLVKPYVTYRSEYVESLWWIIKQIWDKGLLYQDYKVVPHCPRCVTSLSSHELAQGYKEVDDQSVYVKFVVENEDKSFFLVWTTTPWTLPSNVALAVGEKVLYSQIQLKETGEKFILASSLLSKVSEEFEILWEKSGSELVGTKYLPLYQTLESNLQTDRWPNAYKVYSADFVSTTDGTGIVHIAPAYGEDDSRLGDENKLPFLFTVDQTGTVISEKSPGNGKFMKKADEDVKAELLSRGLLYKEETYKHTYPFCWRCKAPLLYFAKNSWYIKMSSLREKLLEGNNDIHWEPDYIKEGRFGDWLREVKDWSFSRERYWGTPLPVWICECGEKSCIGSFEELESKAISPSQLRGRGQGGEGFDPHRPFVDDILIKCDKCGGQMKRVPEVCDVWFDSGCMPFAQWHYPFENKEKIDNNEAYPADYISEAIDQTRGWFYTLLAVATLLGKERPYKNVICLGHVLDTKGKKMSKSIGNIVDPISTIDQFGADAVRWYMYSINQPGDSKRFDLKALDEMVKKVFMILWNVMTFYELYANQPNPTNPTPPSRGGGGPGVGVSKNVLDRWVLARLNQLVKESSEQLDGFKVTEPVRAIGDFINDLSTWFVRRSRDRFKGKDEADKAAALATLRECLITISKMMAPFAPFLSEAIYLRMLGGQSSVHLDTWPTVDETLLDEKLLERMARSRSIVSKILEKRSETGRAVRQPLASATVWLPEGELDEELINIIKDEVNIKAVIIEKGDYNVELDVNLTPELLREGMSRDIIRRINELRKNNKLTIENRIELYFESPDAEAQTMIKEFEDAVKNGTLSSSLRTTGDRPEICETVRINECEVTVGFVVV